MIKDLKDLQKLFKLCRSQGVNSIKLNGVEINFGDMPQALQGVNSYDSTADTTDPYSNFPDRILSPEELTYYSVGGLPPDEDKEAI